MLKVVFNSQLCGSSECTYPCFPRVLLTSTPNNIHFKPMAAPRITIVETVDSGKRGMNPVTKTIINPLKEYWPSQRRG